MKVLGAQLGIRVGSVESRMTVGRRKSRDRGKPCNCEHSMSVRRPGSRHFAADSTRKRWTLGPPPRFCPRQLAVRRSADGPDGSNAIT